MFTCLIAALCLISTGAFGTQASQKKSSKKPAASETMAATPAKAPMTHTTQGTITSISDTQLVVKHRGKDVTYMLNPETQRQGSLMSGSKVTVNYRVENKQNIATAVREVPAKASSSKKKA
jgi:hypothetical protein